MQIVPTLLEKSSESFIQRFHKLSPYFKYFQIDIADGKFVPNRTLSTKDVLKTMKQPAFAEKATAGKWNNGAMEQYVFDFHLMVENYKNELPVLRKISKLVMVKHILIHTSTVPDGPFPPASFPFSFGLVLDPQDSVDDVSKRFDLNIFPVIQIMSVSPGFQGAPFLRETILKVEQLKSKHYRNLILVDGAMRDTTISYVLSQKFVPDIICVGSYLTLEKDPKDHVARLKELIPE